MYSPTDVFVEEISVEKDLSFFYAGPSLQKGELPAVFYFSSTGKSSLSLNPYNQIAQFLQKKKIRLFSWDLPFHKEPFNPEKGLSSLIKSLQKGEDPLPSFFTASEKILSYLFEKKVINLSSCVSCGLSRGSFFALHIASLFDLPFSLHFSPLISFESIEELASFKNASLLKKYALSSLLENLCTKELSFFIGNADKRVKTAFCFDFFHRLMETALRKGIRSPKIELTSYPSVGHLGHGTPPEIFEKGAKWICRKMGL